MVQIHMSISEYVNEFTPLEAANLR